MREGRGGDQSQTQKSSEEDFPEVMITYIIKRTRRAGNAVNTVVLNICILSVAPGCEAEDLQFFMVSRFDIDDGMKDLSSCGGVLIFPYDIYC